MEAVAERSLHTRKLLVVNDDFGALCLPLSAPCWTDSWLSAEAIQRNAHRNGIAAPPIRFLTASPATPCDAVVLRIPKQLALLEWQLATLAQQVPPGALLLAAAMDKHLPDAALPLLEQYWGTATRHRAAGKARLLSAERRDTDTLAVPQDTSYDCPMLQQRLCAGANVFSRSGLDVGSRFMLEYLQRQRPASPVPRCIDLACGNGVLGLAALQWRLAEHVVFCDESAQAMVSAQRNAQRLLGDDVGKRTRFCHGDGIGACGETPVELIVCNPPFHMGHSVEAYVGRRLLQQAAPALAPTGRLLAVANRHLNYEKALGKSYAQVRRVAQNRKFCIWEAGHQR